MSKLVLERNKSLPEMILSMLLKLWAVLSFL